MDEAAVSDYITKSLDGVDVVVASGDSFFFFDPGGKLPADHRFPFATLVTGDRHDKASNLDRPSVYRLNIGVNKETYRAMFGDPPPSIPRDNSPVNTGHDYTALDQIMPHPIYAAMSWVCVLNPSEATFEKVKPLLAEAHAAAAKRDAKRAAR